MAATKTVAHRQRARKSRVPEILAANPQLAITPRHGVVTLFGYGIQVRVDSGHLILEDGIGAERRYARFPRVAHGLERLVTIGHDGMVSLAALRWLADQGAAFVMLDRGGKVLTAAGPVRTSDGRMRRAQGLASQSGAGLRIAREIITQKLAGQEHITREKLNNSEVADAIAGLGSALPGIEDFEGVRLVESQAAGIYWSAWRGKEITYPKAELHRVPEHWRTIGSRRSPISGSPRLAVNPVQAILNYLYAILESEARLAAVAVGLDPCLGVLHMDAPNRESLACDLMEPVRPQVDAFVLDWITKMPLKREWFFEQRDGNCRLMGEFAAQLSETASKWRAALAPLAEWVARVLWVTTGKSFAKGALGTPLTQQRRRTASGTSSLSSVGSVSMQNICASCGADIAASRKYCDTCAESVRSERMAEFARAGRLAAQAPEARARRVAAFRRTSIEQAKWDSSQQPGWLTEEFYRANIQPKLSKLKSPPIQKATGVSRPYAVDIRKGRRTPHPRYWIKLAELTGFLQTS
jgi:CRISPR-associated endonuclease Cas1